MGTFGGQSVSVECSRGTTFTFGFGGLQLVNSVVDKSRSQSCGCQSEPKMGSHLPHCVLTTVYTRV